MGTHATIPSNKYLPVVLAIAKFAGNLAFGRKEKSEQVSAGQNSVAKSTKSCYVFKHVGKCQDINKKCKKKNMVDRL